MIILIWSLDTSWHAIRAGTPIVRVAVTALWSSSRQARANSPGRLVSGLALSATRASSKLQPYNLLKRGSRRLINSTPTFFFVVLFIPTYLVAVKSLFLKELIKIGRAH